MDIERRRLELLGQVKRRDQQEWLRKLLKLKQKVE
jgi:hypothetical protein